MSAPAAPEHVMTPDAQRFEAIVEEECRHILRAAGKLDPVAGHAIVVLAFVAGAAWINGDTTIKRELELRIGLAAERLVDLSAAPPTGEKPDLPDDTDTDPALTPEPFL